MTEYLLSLRIVKKDRGANLVFVVVLLFCSSLFTFGGLQHLSAVGFFSKGEQPFGKSYDAWASEYWNKWIGKNTDQATPKPGGCLTVNNNNKSESMVILMDSADVTTPPTQACQISSNQGIIVPLWAGWCDTGSNGRTSTDEQLALCAREQNLGNIGSEVKVDGIPVAKLEVSQTVNPGVSSVNSIVKSLDNVTNFTSKGFTLTIPADTHKPNQATGTWRAVSDGFWVFLKPLSPGQHTLFYNVRVTPTGALTSPGTNPHFADISYNLQVVR
jgi:hypothetical protein